MPQAAAVSRAVRQIGGGETVGRLAGQLAREVLRLRHDPRLFHGVAQAGSPDKRKRLDRLIVFLRLGLIAVGLEHAEDGALHRRTGEFGGSVVCAGREGDPRHPLRLQRARRDGCGLAHLGGRELVRLASAHHQKPLRAETRRTVQQRRLLGFPGKLAGIVQLLQPAGGSRVHGGIGRSFERENGQRLGLHLVEPAGMQVYFHFVS